MGAPTLSSRLVVLVLVCALSVNCCLRLDRWLKAGTCLDFKEIKQKFLEGNGVSIKDEACLFQEFASPTLKDLGDMFNEWHAGTVPQYIQDNEYSLIGDMTGGFNYSYSNTGTMNGTDYGLLQNDGEITTHRTIEFKFMKGKAGPFPFKAGHATFTYVRYTKTENILTFQAATLSALLFKLPLINKFVINGNHTLLSDAEYELHDEALSNNVETVAIIDVPTQYYSRDISHFSGESDSTNSLQKYNIYSLTGGTNSTLIAHPDETLEDRIKVVMEGTFVDSEREATLDGWGEINVPFNRTHPFNDKNLPLLFSDVRVAVGLFMPNMP